MHLINGEMQLNPNRRQRHSLTFVDRSTSETERKGPVVPRISEVGRNVQVAEKDEHVLLVTEEDLDMSVDRIAAMYPQIHPGSVWSIIHKQNLYCNAAVFK